jgi:hypothetical protein
MPITLPAFGEYVAVVDELRKVFLGPEAGWLAALGRVDSAKPNLVLAPIEVEDGDQIAVRDADDETLDDPRLGSRRRTAQNGCQGARGEPPVNISSGHG